MDEKDIARLWSKIDVRGPDECWPWVAGDRGKGGYGRLSFGRRRKCVRAHRVVWELANERDPGRLFVLHTCDNPPCCNPRHLFLGTNLDNVHDMHAKKRHPHGVKHKLAKLCDAHVRRMRSLRKRGGYSYARLGAMFGVSMIGAYKACKKQTWKHVP